MSFENNKLKTNPEMAARANSELVCLRRRFPKIAYVSCNREAVTQSANAAHSNCLI